MAWWYRTTLGTRRARGLRRIKRRSSERVARQVDLLAHREPRLRLRRLAHHEHFSAALAEALDMPLSPHDSRAFPDGEAKLRPLVDPRG